MYFIISIINYATFSKIIATIFVIIVNYVILLGSWPIICIVIIMNHVLLCELSFIFFFTALSCWILLLPLSTNAASQSVWEDLHGLWKPYIHEPVCVTIPLLSFFFFCLMHPCLEGNSLSFETNFCWLWRSVSLRLLQFWCKQVYWLDLNRQLATYVNDSSLLLDLHLLHLRSKRETKEWRTGHNFLKVFLKVLVFRTPAF